MGYDLGITMGNNFHSTAVFSQELVGNKFFVIQQKNNQKRKLERYKIKYCQRKSQKE